MQLASYPRFVEQTTVSSRIPETLNASLERASESRGVFRSELIRWAIRHYVEQNPDNIEEFDHEKETASTFEDYSDSFCSNCQLQEDE